MLWVYEHTGSLLVAMLMHVSLTVSTLTLGAAIAGTASLIYGLALAAVMWAAAVASITADSGHLFGQRLGARPI
jgi:hypothetical protein